MRIFATYNIKGGVGKTATAINLAYLSAAEGARTLVWDLDPQGAATFYFRVRPKVRGGGKKLIRGERELADLVRATDYRRLDLLPADFTYRHMDRELEGLEKPAKRLARLLQPLASEYDHVFLDCAPSISRLSTGIFVAADALLVPTIPTTLSLRTLRQLQRHLDRRGPKRLEVLPFFCMVDGRKKLHRRICDDTQGTHPPFLASRIPYSSLVEQMGPRRAPLHTYARRSSPARAYAALWREILNGQPPAGMADTDGES